MIGSILFNWKDACNVMYVHVHSVPVQRRREGGRKGGREGGKERERGNSLVGVPE